MHTFNVYSTHFFRAFFLLFFGLMIGNVYGGGGPFKIKVVSNNQGIPYFYMLNDTLKISQPNNSRFIENIDFLVEGALPNGNYAVMVDVFSFSGLIAEDSLSFMNHFTTTSNKLSNILNFNNFSLSFNGDLAGSQNTTHIFFNVRITSSTTNQLITEFRRGLPVVFFAQKRNSNKKGAIKEIHQKSVAIQLPDDQGIVLRDMSEGEYLLEVFSLDGRLLYVQNFEIYSERKDRINISELPNSNLIFFIRITGINGNPYFRSIKKMVR